jgi:hypothetical protein
MVLRYQKLDGAATPPALLLSRGMILAGNGCLLSEVTISPTTIFSALKASTVI